MSVLRSAEQTGVHAVLASETRAPEIPESADVYGWLVGSWQLDVLRYRGVDVRERGLSGEVHFGRVLEGRGVQDVWIMPRRADRRPDDDRSFNMYGTTLRTWDATIQAWRITWSNPVAGHYETQIGRWRGDDIVQVGGRADGTPTRWTYTEITPDSFHWKGEALAEDGETWRLEGEFLGRRMHQHSAAVGGLV